MSERTFIIVASHWPWDHPDSRPYAVDTDRYRDKASAKEAIMELAADRLGDIGIEDAKLLAKHIEVCSKIWRIAEDLGDGKVVINGKTHVLRNELQEYLDDPMKEVWDAV